MIPSDSPTKKAGFPSASFFVFLILLSLFAGLSHAADDKAWAPSRLPNVLPEYETADFWSNRAPHPDKILLTPEEVEKFNRTGLRPDTDLVDIFALPQVMDSASITSLLSDLRAKSHSLKGYDHTNQPLTQAFYEKISASIGPIPPTITPIYGLITTKTNLRKLPTNEIYMDKPFLNEFDRFQYSSLECGTPVAVLHLTLDRAWCYIQSSYAKGWIRSSALATGKKEDVLRFAHSRPLVITGKEAFVYMDAGFLNYYVTLPMGARLPYEEKTNRYYRVSLPLRDTEGKIQMVTGYIKPSADVSIGYLSYTLRNVFLQAFKLLGYPYGWGDMFEGRDCSRFLMDIFYCFGFNMPRHSRFQSQFGERRIDVRNWSEKKKLDLLKELESCPTLLHFPGHIMLSLGVIDHHAYAVHSSWSFRQNSESGNRTFYVGKIVVSDLTFGKGNRRGSLLNRLSAVTPLP